MAGELNNVLDINIEYCIANRRSAVGAKRTPEVVSTQVDRVEQCGKQLTTVGPLARIFRSLHKCVQALVQRERYSKRHLPVTAAVEPLARRDSAPMLLHVHLQR